MFAEDGLVPISALQHALFCERQYALIHLEGIWEENRFTAEGAVLHERVHRDGHESRKTFREEYSLPVHSLRWGLTGKCDLVEIWYGKDGSVEKVSPVEFKRGRKKADDTDRVQLCAQALCLEEMFGVPVGSGQFYYLQEHRRTDAVIDTELREKTAALVGRIMALSESGRTVAAQYSRRKCDNCSLVDVCMPKYTGTEHKNVERYIQSHLRLAEKDGAETA